MDLLLNFDWIKKSHRVAHESQRHGELCYCYQEAFFIEGSQLTKFCLSRNPYKIGVQVSFKVPQFLDFQEFQTKARILPWHTKSTRMLIIHLLKGHELPCFGDFCVLS